MKLNRVICAALLLMVPGAFYAADGKKTERPSTTPPADKPLPAIEADVRGVRWGMSREEVRQREKAARLRTATRGQLEYQDTILAQQVRVFYSFTGNRLTSVDIVFATGRGLEGALLRALLKMVVDKYGKAGSSLTGRYGSSPYTRHEWMLKRTAIRLESFSGGVKIGYGSRGLADTAPVFTPGKDDRNKL